MVPRFDQIKTQNGQRVLIVRLGAMGDLIHSLPLAQDLKTAGCVVEWLVEDRWAPLLQGSSAIDRLWLLPRQGWKRSKASVGQRFDDFRHLARLLSRCDFDAVIDAQGLAKSAVFSMAIGTPRRIGHSWERAREGSWLISTHRAPSGAVHVVDQQRALALPLLGRKHPRGPWQFPLPAFDAERAWAQKWLAGTGISSPWILNVGAGWPSKLWPLERCQALTRLALMQGKQVLILWGGKDEEARAKEIQAAAPGVILAPPTDLPRMVGLIAQAQVFISADTGPLHLAFALGRPTVGLFGPVPAERNGPRGKKSINLQAPGKLWERNNVAQGRMDTITEDAVFSAAQELCSWQP
jgi:heptosyltransferase-1